MKVNIILAILYFIATFFWERKIFQFPVDENILTYMICKCLELLILIAIVLGIRKLRISGIETKNRIKGICKYALPYLGVLMIVSLYKYHNGTLSYLGGDEEHILLRALRYNCVSYMFGYFTGYYYIIIMSLIPSIYAPLIVKLLIQAFALGYMMFRINKIWKSKLIYLWYLLFLGQPVLLELGPQVHRLPLYSLLYIIIITKIFCDYDEKIELKRWEMLMMMFAFATLSQWRVEGIYLIVFAPLLLIFAYRIRTRKKIIWMFITFWFMTVIVAIPQTIENAQTENYVSERMSHFYNYVFVNMCRNGLNQEKYQKEFEIIDKYLSIEAVNRINQDLGDFNYADELIAIYDGYIGIRENYSHEQYQAYTKAMLKIIIENPFLYIRSQGKAWNYISMLEGEDFETKQTGIFKIAKYLLVIERFLVRQLYIPTLVIIMAAIYSLLKKRWLELTTTVAIFAHSCIVFLLMPAAYFKYYYIVYLGGYFILLWHILEGRCKKHERQDIDIYSNV